MLNKIESLDQSLMLYLNGMHNSFMNVVMYYVSEGWFWIPVYVLVLFLVYKKYSLKGMSYFLIFAGLSILLSDRISVMAFKEVFLRYRPCHNETIGHLIHTYDGHCGGQYGFVSSHATNFFSIAMLMGLTLRGTYRYAMPLLLFWAALIAYSRIYLGVHYPLDILGGTILGSIIGLVCYKLFSRVVRG